MSHVRFFALLACCSFLACSSSDGDPAPSNDSGTKDAPVFDTYVAPFPDAPPPDDAFDSSPGDASKCVGSGEPCGDCMATNCCDQGTACAADKDCQAAALCVATACTKSFDECAVDCNTKGNPTFKAYVACADAKGCATKCKP